VARVARLTVVVAALGAAVTAGLSTYVAHRSLTAGMDTRLRGAALALADEIRAGLTLDEVRRDVEEDGRELAHAGLQIAVFEGPHLLGGDPTTPVGPGTGCATVGKLRLCAERAGARLVVVAGPGDAIRSQLHLFAEAALVGVLFTVFAAVLIGRRLAARVVAPLTRLRQAVATVPDDAPGSADLGADEGWEEVDALRRVLGQVLSRLDLAVAQARHFAADAAHELRTPVATMRAELELVAEEPTDLPGARAAIARVHRTLLSVSALIDRLLILALPTPSGAPEGQAVALSEIVREAVDALPEASRARVTTHLEDEGIVRGDAALLRALVDNAVDNALKFSAPHPVLCKVASQGGRVITTVADHGPGVPRQEHERVFEPFYRTSAARASTVRGHGIGLALIAHVAAGHGGQAAFREVDRGALLEVNLPAWTPGAPPR
jgi:signal transduction histidine kinase